jgi:hypothetical protein
MKDRQMFVDTKLTNSTYDSLTGVKYKDEIGRMQLFHDERETVAVFAVFAL